MNFEDRLREAAAEANRIIMSDLPEPEDCVHEFSPKFERAVRRMTRRAETPVRYRLRQAACVAVALLSLVSAYLMVNTDAQARFFGWVKEQYEIWVHHFFEGEDTADTTLNIAYRPTWIPEGYTEKTVRSQASGVMIIYKNENDQSVRFHYTTDIKSRNLYINKDCMTELIVQVNGKDAQLYESLDSKIAPTIIWKNEDETVLFILTGHIESEMLVKMAESVM